MNAILLTSGTHWQHGGVQRKASGPTMPPRPGATSADGGALPQAAVQPRLPESAGGNYLKQPTAGARLETALFVAVQAVMIACVVAVAAEMFATA